MTRAAAETLAAQLNADAPDDVSYRVEQTTNPAGSVTPFYVRRRACRAVNADPERHTQPGAQLALVA